MDFEADEEIQGYGANQMMELNEITPTDLDTNQRRKQFFSFQNWGNNIVAGQIKLTICFFLPSVGKYSS